MSPVDRAASTMMVGNALRIELLCVQNQIKEMRRHAGLS